MYSQTEERKSKYIILTIILVIFLITLTILVYYIRFQTTISPRANSFNKTNSISISNSYVFASPVRAKASGDMIRVTVFILDSEGNGLFDKKVSLRSNNDSLVIKDIQSLTDETGKAIFDVSSSLVSDYIIEVLIDAVVLPQSLKISFD